MNPLFLIIFYFTGVIVAAFAIKVHNKANINFQKKFPPVAIIFSWITVLIVSINAIADFWTNGGKKSFYKWFNYEE